MAFISATKPVSGNNSFVMYTNPTRSNVVKRTTPQITKAIFKFWISVTAKKTQDKAKSKFSIATERM